MSPMFSLELKMFIDKTMLWALLQQLWYVHWLSNWVSSPQVIDIYIKNKWYIEENSIDWLTKNFFCYNTVWTCLWFQPPTCECTYALPLSYIMFVQCCNASEIQSGWQIHTLDRMRPKSRTDLLWKFCMSKSMIWEFKNPCKFDDRAK